MVQLIYNEWEKIFKQVSTYLMIGFIVMIVIAFGGITKYLDLKAEQRAENWKEELLAENKSLQQAIEETKVVTPSYKEFTQRQIALNEYRVEHDLPPTSQSTVWTFINDSTSLINFAGLFVIVIAAGIVAHEFSWGTIKVLLVKPFKRWKILLAKYVTVNLFLLFILMLLFVSTAIIGAILFGTGESAQNVHLAYVNGAVEEQSLLFHLIKVYVLNSLSIFLLAAMAFMISAVFRNSGLAIGVSVFLLLVGGTVTNLLASKFDWAKYSLFANTDLMQYVDGMPLVEGMTISFSVTMMIIYFVLFMLLAFIFFTKRDVAT